MNLFVWFVCTHHHLITLLVPYLAPHLSGWLVSISKQLLSKIIDDAVQRVLEEVIPWLFHQLGNITRYFT